MTAATERTGKKLGLVIDLDICVGCHACATICKAWNSDSPSDGLSDPYGADPQGVWFNRVHSYETVDGRSRRTVYFPRSCLHCETPACVTVCPTGAAYRRSADGISLVDGNVCMGCKLCSWACPYGAREYDQNTGIMRKCTLCADRLDAADMSAADHVPACVQACPTGARHFGDLGDPDSQVSRLVAARDGFAPTPVPGYRPVNRYLPPRPKPSTSMAETEPEDLQGAAERFFAWADQILQR